jgi:O-antigen/teichoic acid export membrane protein
VTGILALALFVSVVFLSPYILNLYGDDFGGGRVVIVLLAFSAALQAVNGVVGQFVAALEKVWIATGINAVWAVTVVVGSLILIPRYGAVGLALAQVISFVLHTLWQSIYVVRLCACMPSTDTEFGEELVSAGVDHG